jgi:S-adenosylmethionine synthetase
MCFSLFKKKASAIKPPKFYQSSSEFVSTAHPDRVSDVLAALVINDIQKVDGPKSHAAIEVFLTHDAVYFGGEATTSIKIDNKYLRRILCQGFDMCGYYPEMRKHWTKDEVVLAEDLKVFNKICAQSPDIALGTTDKGEESGWNDQGVFFSSADNTTKSHLGTPQFVAQLIGEDLLQVSHESIFEPSKYHLVLGPDNKVVVTCRVAEDGFTPIEVTAITIAVAHSSQSEIENVRSFVRNRVKRLLVENNIQIATYCKWVINGTGRFVVHGCVSDTSMTGRKISVNHPSAGPVWANKMIGGGSLVKPAHASDLILNLALCYIANVVVTANLSSYAVVGCAGAIGVQGLQSIFIKGDENYEASDISTKVERYFKNSIVWAPIAIAKKFDFFSEEFNFAQAVADNFFGHPESQPWENPALILREAMNLKEYLELH